MLKKCVIILLFFSVSMSLPARQQKEWGKPIWYTAMLFAVEFGAIMAMGINDKEPSFDNVRSAFSTWPKKDDDSWIYNRLLHPLMGSETYLRAREAKFGVWGSFKFSMGASIVWEYFIESWIEHPSTQDLIYTTGYGWLLGEVRFQLKKLFEGPNFWILDPINSLITHADLKFVPIEDRLVPVPMIAFNYTY